MPQVPYEILELIIANVERNDLEACSSISKPFLSIARGHLFSSVDFMGGLPQEKIRGSRLEQFNGLIDVAPEIALCVRNFSFQMFESDYVDEQVHRVLKKLTKIKTFCLYPSSSNLPWETIPNPLRTIIANMLHLPTVTELMLLGFTKFPAAILAKVTQLEGLVLMDMEISDLDPDDVAWSPSQNFSQSPKARPRSVNWTNNQITHTITSSHPVISVLSSAFDLSRVEMFQMRLRSKDDLAILEGVFKVAGEIMKSLTLGGNQSLLCALNLIPVPNLQMLTIMSVLPLNEETSSTTVPLRSPTFDLTSVSNLRTLKIVISQWDFDEDSFHFLIHGLQKSSTTPFPHLISISIHLGLDTPETYGQLCESDLWVTIDALFANRKAFPALEKFNIEVMIYTCPSAELLPQLERDHENRFENFDGLLQNDAIRLEFNTSVWDGEQRQINNLYTLIYPDP